MQKKCSSITLRKNLLVSVIKKIGNSCLLLALIPIFGAHCPEKIELIVTDLDGRTVKAIGVGQKVNLKVKITGDMAYDTIAVPGIEQFNFEPRGTYKTVYSVNGVTTRSVDHNFVIVPHKEGTFVLGPLEICTTGKTVQSNMVKLVVKKNLPHSSKREDVFLEFFPEKPQIYAGEKCLLTIRLSSCKEIELLEVKLPEFDKSIHASNPQKGIQGKKTLHDKEYVFYEWNVDVVAHMPGQWPISQAQALCALTKDDMFSHARRLGAALIQFGFCNEQKRFYSQPFVLDVLPLPPTTQKVHAVGAFDGFVCSIDNNLIEEGGAALLKLTIRGNGDLEAIKKIDLDLPEGLKFYESKTESKVDSKMFEYVIQALKAGEYTIPAQKFNFFNPSIGYYDSLTTEPITIIVKEKSLGSVQIQQQGHQEGSVADAANEHVLSINENGPWHVVSKRYIPWRYFFVLCCMGILWIVGVIVIRYKKIHQEKRNMILRKKKAFVLARKRLLAAQHSNDSKKIYDIFIQALADYTLTTPGNISESTIHKLVGRVLLEPQMVNQWERFYYDISSISFGLGAERETAELFKRAYVWIEQLEALL